LFLLKIDDGYIKRATPFHPKINQDRSAESRLKELEDAYLVLTDDKLREVLDRYRRDKSNRQMDSIIIKGLKYREPTVQKTQAELKAELEKAERLHKEEKEKERYEELLATCMNGIRSKGALRLEKINDKLMKKFAKECRYR